MRAWLLGLALIAAPAASETVGQVAAHHRLAGEVLVAKGDRGLFDRGYGAIGEIQGVQARNSILPEDDLVVIVFTNRSADDFAPGEVWQRSGFAYDLLSAAACR